MTDIWFEKLCRFGTVLGQFNVQKLASLVMGSRETPQSATPLLKNVVRHLKDKSLYEFGFSSEFLLTPDDTLLVGLDSYVDDKFSRKKAVFHHKARLPFQLPTLYFCQCFNFRNS